MLWWWQNRDLVDTLIVGIGGLVDRGVPISGICILLAHATILSRNLPISGSPAHGKAVNSEGGLPDSNRNALPFLAANPNPAIEFEVISDHGDLF